MGGIALTIMGAAMLLGCDRVKQAVVPYAILIAGVFCAFTGH